VPNTPSTQDKRELYLWSQSFEADVHQSIEGRSNPKQDVSVVVVVVNPGVVSVLHFLWVMSATPETPHFS